MTYVALLRGINVGAKNTLPMKALSALFEEAGCVEVKTLIQSGNVVFSASAKVAKGASEAVARAITKKFGFSAPVIVRSSDELAEIARDNPFLRGKADVEKLHVAFLSSAPTASGVAALDPKRSPGDELLVKGSAIYLHLPNGVGRSKLTNAYFDRTLATTSTVRNWRTVLKLVELSG